MTKTSKYISRVYLTIIFGILYIPIITLIFFSFNASNSTAVFTGFSLRWYRELFRSPDTFAALRNTLVLAICSSALATVIGTAAAAGIHRMKNKFAKKAVLSVTNIPMMNPDIVTGISMMLLFVFVCVRLAGAASLSFATVLIAHITFNLPYVILSVMPKLRQMDKHLTEAALDLGCTPMQAFFKVELPSIMPGVISGLIMAFTLSLDDFVISYFTTGSGFETLPIRIYSMTKKRVTPDMYALSTLIFIAVLALLVLSNLAGSKSEKKSHAKVPAQTEVTK